jgi:hypothetical protein
MLGYLMYLNNFTFEPYQGSPNQVNFANVLTEVAPPGLQSEIKVARVINFVTIVFSQILQLFDPDNLIDSRH